MEGPLYPKQPVTAQSPVANPAHCDAQDAGQVGAVVGATTGTTTGADTGTDTGADTGQVGGGVGNTITNAGAGVGNTNTHAGATTGAGVTTGTATGTGAGAGADTGVALGADTGTGTGGGLGPGIYPTQPATKQVPGANPTHFDAQDAGHCCNFRRAESVEADTIPMTRVATIAINRRIIIVRFWVESLSSNWQTRASA